MTSVLSISSYTLLGSTVTSSFSQIKFPAKSRRPSSSTPKVRSHEADEFAAGHTALSASTSGRRGLLFIATLPCLLPSIQIMDCHGANAIESGTKEYLLIKEEVRKVLSKGKAAGVLRLVFHDAGTFEMDDNTGGMNGSIVYELDRPENSGLKKSLKVLQKAKNQTDAIKPVSWADMIAVAGAEAVAVCGGPKIQVSVGRLDSLEPDPEGKLPEESLDAFGLKKCFLRTQELVALSGAHTLGSKGFGSPTSFDNSYYKVLLEKPWVSSGGMSSMTGLPSDHALVEDDECLRWIKKYALNENMFFEDFKNAYVKLVNSGVRWKRL
ncbi:putative L-ascorbate peroxidase 6 isoform X2 [Prosopis cineraria]|uniref:putative L-ascorbate peroxidase 6 isoform X2 n=1 Tax=Prosopis cineraria TaxID=364024 RepID=UPI00240EE345|nr:putative L-ascorbate peroxidase 6 isoform X2 [Prosopis cineraria]